MKMTLVGAGVRTPYLLRGLAARGDDLGLTEVVLHDTDPGRLDAMSALGSFLCREWGARFVVRGEPDPKAALAGAHFVFTAIRVGQDAARTVDEQIPLRHGVLGQETTGPGGFAMAVRTIPHMLRLADLISDVAPDALVVNFTNPVGLILQALSDHTAVRAVGVCDGPIGMGRDVAELLDRPASEVRTDYFGLNHCGWIHRVVVDGRDRLPGVLDRYEELQGIDHSWAMFDPSLVRTLGMLPMEYLYFYYYRDLAVGHIRGSGSTRGEQVEAINASLWPALSERIGAGDAAGARDAWSSAMQARGATYFARERGEEVRDELTRDDAQADPFVSDGYQGVALGVMTAVAQDRETSLVLNTRNDGAIEGLRDDDVVEVSCLVDASGIRSLRQGPLPEAARAIVEPVKAYERLTVRAVMEGSYDTALGALMAHPLVGSYPVARAILDDYVLAHPGFLDGPPL